MGKETIITVVWKHHVSTLNKEQTVGLVPMAPLQKVVVVFTLNQSWWHFDVVSNYMKAALYMKAYEVNALHIGMIYIYCMPLIN